MFLLHLKSSSSLRRCWLDQHHRSLHLKQPNQHPFLRQNKISNPGEVLLQDRRSQQDEMGLAIEGRGEEEVPNGFPQAGGAAGQKERAGANCFQGLWLGQQKPPGRWGLAIEEGTILSIEIRNFYFSIFNINFCLSSITSFSTRDR